MSSAPGAVAAVTPAADAPAPEVRYAGLATRAISFALDAAVINLVATIVGVGAALILSLLHMPHTVRTVLTVIGGVAYVLWVIGYFVAFWSTAGQTPGARAMRIRVLTAAGHTPGVGQGLVRCAGIGLAAVPLFLGFVPVLFDDRRRAFQDWLARTVVVEAGGAPSAAAQVPAHPEAG